ncbi:MAG: DUF732 domain-containing protein [Mycobacterium sp.]
MQHTVRRSPKGSTSAAAASVLAAFATALVTGCASGGGLMPTMAVPPSATTKSGADPRGGPQPPAAITQPSTLIVTGQQRAYLDALSAAGVRPSSDLMALSIGSYVCQARAAKQTEQAVWDYALPLVRGDVRDAGRNAMAPSASEVNALTADYIRIATERLC